VDPGHAAAHAGVVEQEAPLEVVEAVDDQVDAGQQLGDDAGVVERFAVGDVEPLLEVYNLLNENASVTEVEQVGAALGRVSRNLDGRLVRVGFKVGF